ncbi:MAG TPA: hypothetical protein VL053_03845, partial [Arachidicoccus sp.]|nr:hypothetical protein [Arachidicoccus sp.]
MHYFKAKYRKTAGPKAGSLRRLGITMLSVIIIPAGNSLQAQDYPFKPVAFTQVQLTDGFWKPKIEVNA